jgi:hypothetical protein
MLRKNGQGYEVDNTLYGMGKVEVNFFHFLWFIISWWFVKAESLVKGDWSGFEIDNNRGNSHPSFLMQTYKEFNYHQNYLIVILLEFM